MLSLVTKRVLSSAYLAKYCVKNMNMLQMKILKRTNLNIEPFGNLESVFFQELIFGIYDLVSGIEEA